MSWRDVLKIHSACELLPPLPPDELKALGEDIKKNRLQERAKVTRQGDDFVLIDGRSRLDAIEAVGLPIKVFEGTTLNNKFFEVVTEIGDPLDYVWSLNFRRRHLSDEQKRDVIAAFIKAKPERSNRQIAKRLDASPTTVGKVRDQLEDAGDVSTVGHVDTRGRVQSAHKTKSGAPPSDAPVPAPPASRKPTTSPIIEQRVNDGERAEASCVLEIARRIRARDPRSDIVTLCNWIEKYAVPMVAVTWNPSPHATGTPPVQETELTVPAQPEAGEASP
jgi:transposase-like protein